MRPPIPRTLALALVLLATALAAGFWRFSYDDAFITYRYAVNLAETGRFEFNPGETVLGTTAPGWALLLAALARLSPPALDVAAWGTLLSLASLVALAFALASALRSASATARAGLPLLFGFLALTLRWNVEMLGAETMAVAALVPWGVLVALRGRPVLGGLLLAGATLCRLDAALAFVILLPVLVWLERRGGQHRASSGSVRVALAFGLPVALFLAGLALHFGSLLPNTLGAKQSERTAELPAYSAMEWRWLERSLPATGAAAAALALAVLPLGAGVARWRRVADRSPEALTAGVLAVWLLGHELAYRVLAVPFAPWYHVPAVNAVVALAAAGALAVGTLLAPRPVSPRLRPAAAFTLAVLILAAVFRPGAFVHSFWQTTPDPRFVAFRTIGEHLARTAPEGATVAALEIGVIGYFAPRQRVLDLGGLVSPEVLAARRDGRLAELVAERRPEYLVHSTHFPAIFDPLLAHPEIAAGYAEERRIPDGRGNELVLLAARGAP